MSRNTYRYLLLAIATLVLTLQFFTNSVLAAPVADPHVIKLSETKSYKISEQDLAKGKKLFNSACANCHAGGATYTNPNVGLDLKTLALATPPRDSVTGMVDYLKNPTTFDGVEEIYETHPSLRSTDIFPMMRGLTDKDLKQISGYILYKGNLQGVGWGGGKIYY